MTRSTGFDKIYMLLHRSDLNISEKFRHFFRFFWQNFAKKFLRGGQILMNFLSILKGSFLEVRKAENGDGKRKGVFFCRNFADNLENVEIFRNLNFLAKIPEFCVRILTEG